MFRGCVSTKATQNARFEQMTKQQQLIEQKKQEIQRKLEEKKRKETEEALKKLNPEAAAVVDRRGPIISNSRTRWPSKRSSDVLEKETVAPVRPSNVFSNDGSFLDQFKKMTGMKSLPKCPKREDSSANNTSNVKDKVVDKHSGYSPVEFYSDNHGNGGNDVNRIEVRSKNSNDENLSDKGRSGRWTRSPTPKSTLDTVPLLPSQPSPVLPVYPNSSTLHQEPIHTLPVPSPILQSSSLFSPLPSYSQDSTVMTNSYSLPLVPPPLRAALIPPPAPINPGTIPAPSPILPCSIPPPSPIQPSAIPPPSPIIPHSIPPPLPISPNMIPRPSPLSLQDIPPPPTPRQANHMITSPSVLPCSPSPPPVPGSIYIPLPRSSTDDNFSTDLPTLPSTIPMPSHHIIKYPSESRPQNNLTQHTVTSTVSCSVPAESASDDDDDDEEEESPEENEDDDKDEKAVKKEFDALYTETLDDSMVDEKRSTDLTSQAVVADVVKQEHEDSLNQISSLNNSSSIQMSSVFEDDNSMGPNCLKSESDLIDGIPMTESYDHFSSRVDETEVKKELQQDDSSQDGGSAAAMRRKKRRSRWAPETETIPTPPPAVGPIGVVTPTVLGATSLALPNTLTINLPGMKGPLLSQLSRADPALLQYAIKNFGSTQLSDEDWKKAEDHFKINLLYQDVLKKRRELEKIQAAGKFKYEYDSDEETEGGTWEHKLREKEMLATQLWADELTEAAKGKHHIGDFLPPEELSRFMEKYEAMKHGRPPDLSDYKEYKLKEDNIGFQMLQKLGWTEGQGLGSDGSGIVDPVNKATVRADNQGLGVERPEDVSVGDDEYDAYRKRMMLAYRFRPNPLNNPRRPYY